MFYDLIIVLMSFHPHSLHIALMKLMLLCMVLDVCCDHFFLLIVDFTPLVQSCSYYRKYECHE
jgi:hypothetical protein